MEAYQDLANRVNDFLGSELNFSAYDFMNPTKEKLRDFLLLAIQELFVNAESVRHVFGQDTTCSMISVINTYGTMLLLFPIDESEVGVTDLLRPSSNVMVFIVSRIIDFLDCADTHLTRVFSLAEKYREAKKMLKQLLDEIDKLLHASHETKMHIHKLQDVVTARRTEYENVSVKYGESSKQVQSQEQILKEANLKLEAVNQKKQNISRAINSLKEKIIALRPEGEFSECYLDDINTLQTKFEDIKKQGKHLLHMITIKKETERNLMKLKKQCLQSQELYEKLETLFIAISEMKKTKSAQQSLPTLKMEIEDSRSRLFAIEKDLSEQLETLNSNSVKREEQKNNITAEIDECNSSLEKFNNEKRNLEYSLKTLSNLVNGHNEKIKHLYEVCTDEMNENTTLVQFKQCYEQMCQNALTELEKVKEFFERNV